ncbi:MAG: dihydropteroate synthase [Deltaproteobacteria bacterium]|nr:dihydropteroate synthase [Deltaproteobacteria bacterium]
MVASFRCKERTLVIGRRTLVMGILNVTPDSFHDGGRARDPDAALERAAALVAGGADVVDVGGESTRPGAAEVSGAEEIERVVPVIERIASSLDVVVSVDTSKAAVAERALAAGAHIVNDVTALGDPDMADVVRRSGAGLALMHMRGTPRNMQHDPRYDDVVEEVRAFLGARVAFARAAGIAADRVVVDPGIGFGKSFTHNWELLRHLGRLRDLGWPVLVGLSRKTFLGELVGGGGPERRGPPTFAAAVAAVLAGADLLRLHDPAEARPFLAVADRMRYGEASEESAR